MKKLLLILAAILSSWGFAPITFLAGGVLGISRIVPEALCDMRGECKKTYTAADMPAFNCIEPQPKDGHRSFPCRENFGFGIGRFQVAVYRPSDGRVYQVPLWYWTDEKLKDPATSLMLPTKNNTSDNTKYSSAISVISSTPTSQTISISSRYETGGLSSVYIDFMYETDGATIKPISSKIMPENFLMSLTSGFFVAWAFRRMALIWRRRLLRGTAPA